MSVGPHAGPVERASQSRDLSELFRRVEALERVRAGSLPAVRASASADTYNGTQDAVWNNGIVVSPDGVFSPDLGDDTHILINQAGLYLFRGTLLPSPPIENTITYTAYVIDAGASILGAANLVDIRDASVGTPRSDSFVVGADTLYFDTLTNFPLVVRGRIDASGAEDLNLVTMDIFQIRSRADLA